MRIIIIIIWRHGYTLTVDRLQKRKGQLEKKHVDPSYPAPKLMSRTRHNIASMIRRYGKKIILD